SSVQDLWRRVMVGETLERLVTKTRSSRRKTDVLDVTEEVELALDSVGAMILDAELLDPEQLDAGLDDTQEPPLKSRVDDESSLRICSRRSSIVESDFDLPTPAEIAQIRDAIEDAPLPDFEVKEARKTRVRAPKCTAQVDYETSLGPSQMALLRRARQSVEGCIAMGLIQKATPIELACFLADLERADLYSTTRAGAFLRRTRAALNAWPSSEGSTAQDVEHFRGEDSPGPLLTPPRASVAPSVSSDDMSSRRSSIFNPLDVFQDNAVVRDRFQEANENNETFEKLHEELPQKRKGEDTDEWSCRFRSSLKSLFQNPGYDKIDFTDIAPIASMTKEGAASIFASLLSLASCDDVTVIQAVAFGSITIAPGPFMLDDSVCSQNSLASASASVVSLA
ncbi:MAG: uncharacterized protein KVP18_002145, partial [Porospora cf. gigantea A]|uniref:uncharacterized protein n=1 Tax=Porospora cf. gigantea A TaxID=2853593 RepID=UPI00355ACD49